MNKINSENIVLKSGIDLDSFLNIITQTLDISKQLPYIHIYAAIQNKTINSITEPITLENVRFNDPCLNISFNEEESSFQFFDGFGEVSIDGIMHFQVQNMQDAKNVRTYVILGYSDDNFQTVNYYDNLTIIDNRILPSGTSEFVTPFHFSLYLEGEENYMRKFRLYTNTVLPSEATLSLVRRSNIEISCYPNEFR